MIAVLGIIVEPKELLHAPLKKKERERGRKEKKERRSEGERERETEYLFFDGVFRII